MEQPKRDSSELRPIEASAAADPMDGLLSSASFRADPSRSFVPSEEVEAVLSELGSNDPDVRLRGAAKLSRELEAKYSPSDRSKLSQSLYQLIAADSYIEVRNYAASALGVLEPTLSIGAEKFVALLIQSSRETRESDNYRRYFKELRKAGEKLTLPQAETAYLSKLLLVLGAENPEPSVKEFSKRVLQTLPAALTHKESEGVLRSYRAGLPEAIAEWDSRLVEVAKKLRLKLPRSFKPYRIDQTPGEEPKSRRKPSPGVARTSVDLEADEESEHSSECALVSEAPAENPFLTRDQGTRELEQGLIKVILNPGSISRSQFLQKLEELGEIGWADSIQPLKVILNGEALDRRGLRPLLHDDPEVRQLTRASIRRIEQREEECALLFELSPAAIPTPKYSSPFTDPLSSEVLVARLERRLERLKEIGGIRSATVLPKFIAMEGEFKGWDKLLSDAELRRVKFKAEQVSLGHGPK